MRRCCFVILSQRNSAAFLQHFCIIYHIIMILYAMHYYMNDKLCKLYMSKFIKKE